MMDVLMILATVIVAGTATWIYRCRKKETCSFKGEMSSVMNHLDQGRTLTADQAKKYYGIRHLRSVVSRLRNKYKQDIETITVNKKAMYRKKH